MKMMIFSLMASVAMAGTAMAADAVVYNEPAPQTAPVTTDYNWSGFYIGGQLGYGWADLEGAALGGSVDADGVLGGVHAGYNYDLGTFVIGAEVDFDLADLQLDGGLGEIDRVARGKLKGGVAFDRALAYVTGGIAYAEADTVLGNFDDIGYAVGGGLDYAVTDDIIVGGEYLYHGFDDFDDTGIDVDVHTVKAKVSFKF